MRRSKTLLHVKRLRCYGVRRVGDATETSAIHQRTTSRFPSPKRWCARHGTTIRNSHTASRIRCTTPESRLARPVP